MLQKGSIKSGIIKKPLWASCVPGHRWARACNAPLGTSAPADQHHCTTRSGPSHPRGAGPSSTHRTLLCSRCEIPDRKNHLAPPPRPRPGILQLGHQMAQTLGPSQSNQFPAEGSQGGPGGNGSRNPETASALRRGHPGLLLRLPSEPVGPRSHLQMGPSGARRAGHTRCRAARRTHSDRHPAVFSLFQKRI